MADTPDQQQRQPSLRPAMPCELLSERLLLMAVVPADAPCITAAVQESLNELRQWMPWAQTEPTVDHTLEFVRLSTHHRAQGKELNYTLWRGHARAGRTLERYVGNIGVHNIDWDVPRFELGYWIRTRCAGQGYATEATKTLTQTLIRLYQPPRLEIRTDIRNRASRRVAERAGYVQEAILRRHVRDNVGELSDTVIYSLLPGEETGG